MATNNKKRTTKLDPKTVRWCAGKLRNEARALERLATKLTAGPEGFKETAFWHAGELSVRATELRNMASLLLEHVR